MKRRPTKATSAKERERRANAVLSKSKPGAIPRGIKFVSFRDLTPAERAQGKSLSGRAAELLAGKSRKLAVSH
jgi:hypothetical protein